MKMKKIAAFLSAMVLVGTVSPMYQGVSVSMVAEASVFNSEPGEKSYSLNYYGDTLMYRELEDGTLEITSFGRIPTRVEPERLFDTTSITIPEKIDGKIVTSIGDEAFNDFSGLSGNLVSSLYLPDTITHIGKRAFYCKNLTSLSLPESLVSIGDGAFTCCMELTSITIPANVSEIGVDLFQSCHKLSSIRVDKENESFCSVDDVLYDIDKTTLIACPKRKTSLVVPEGVTTIAPRACHYCKDLASVHLPESLTRIEYGSFHNCDKLKDINIPDSVEFIGIDAFCADYALTSIHIPTNLTELTDYSFAALTSLTSIEIPEGITKIGKHALGGCEKVTSIKIPEGVTELEEGAFYNCSGLTEIELPNTLKTIGNNVFESCPSLTTLTIPDSVEVIGDSIVSNCTSLKSIEVSENNPNYASVDGVLFNKDKTVLLACPATLTEYTIPEGTVEIAKSAFFSCNNLKSITFPEKSLVSIGDSAFSKCKVLESVTLPESLKTIGERAFYYCTALSDVVIPDGVESIGSCAFSGDAALTGITLPSTITTIEESTFSGTGLTAIDIPGNVETIEDNAFYNCYELSDVTFAEGLKNIGRSIFANCSKITTFTIPSTVEKLNIGNLSDKLTDITILNPECELDDIYRLKEATVYGYRNSTAQAAAEKVGATFIPLDDAAEVMMGDVNGDGVLNLSDAVLLQKWLVAVPETSLRSMAAADLNQDEAVNVFDLLLMKRALLDKTVE